jgi:hypothetical protein
MKVSNDTLILIDKIIKITERYSVNVANYLQYLDDNNSNGRYANRIAIETDRLIEFIGLHESLQEQFTILIDYLKSTEQQKIEFQKGFILAYEKYKNIELINKDAVELNNKINYYKKAAKLLFNEVNRLKNEQQNN